MKKLLLLPLAVILFAVPMADDLFFEGFESTSMPSGWQIWEENTPYYYSWDFWYDEDFGNGHNSDGYAHHYYDYYYEADSWLVTPALDMSGYENLSLSVWQCGHHVYDYIGTFIMGTAVASPSANDFIQLYELGEPNIWPYWEEHIADASEFDGQPTVTFAIRYIDYTWPDEGHGLYLDDVLVTGDVGTRIEAASLGAIKAIYK